MTAFCHEGLSEKFISDYEDRFQCLLDNGTLIESEEKILVLSPEDYYFFKHVNLENLHGKYIPKTMYKSFSNIITLNGILYDKDRGKFLLKGCSTYIFDFQELKTLEISFLDSKLGKPKCA